MKIDIENLELSVDNYGNAVYYTKDATAFLGSAQGFVFDLLRTAKWGDSEHDLKFQGINSFLKFKEDEFEYPLVKRICDRCKGKGTHGNPAFNGTTIEWWQESGGPDWQEDLEEYMHGDMYDVACEQGCDGGIAYDIDWVRIVNLYYLNADDSNDSKIVRDGCSTQLNWIHSSLMDYYDHMSEMAAERRAGC